MTTNAYAAKRALIAKLAELAEHGTIAAQVAYAFPGSTLSNAVVYGGGVTFDQPGDKDAVDGRRRLVYESAQIGIHVRVSVSPPPANGIEDTDLMVEAIGEVIGTLLNTEPDLCGGNSVARIIGGQGDYQPLDGTCVSTLSYRISVESYIE